MQEYVEKLERDGYCVMEGAFDPAWAEELRVLTDEQFAEATGLIGHWHETKGKTDPGPAFDWERLRRGVERELKRW